MKGLERVVQESFGSPGEQGRVGEGQSDKEGDTGGLMGPWWHL